MSEDRGNFEFEIALSKPALSFICECKKASPSKGIIAEEFPYLEIAKAVSVPCLRKDFVVSDYQRAVGFGVSTPEQAKRMASLSDGAIAGSAIIKLIERDKRQAPSSVGAYIREMKTATEN